MKKSLISSALLGLMCLSSFALAQAKPEASTNLIQLAAKQNAVSYYLAQDDQSNDVTQDQDQSSSDSDTNGDEDTNGDQDANMSSSNQDQSTDNNGDDQSGDSDSDSDSDSDYE